VGTTTITASQAANGNYGPGTATANLTVTGSIPPTPPTPPTPVLTFATANTLTVALGSTATNIATSNYSGGNYGAITYTSSNSSIATVNASTGLVTPITTGSTTITATQAAVSGVNQIATQNYTLNVTLANQTISASAASSEISVGSTTLITVTGGQGNGALSFSSSNPAVATVNSATGIVTGIRAGSVTITATKAADSIYASASSTVSITVLNSSTSLVLSASNTSPEIGQSVTLTASITPPLATGTITFKEGSQVLGTAAIVNGVASIALSSFSIGTHQIFAVYGGNSAYPPSTSNSINIAVSRSNPANDLRVRGLVTAQVDLTRQSVAINISTNQRRLEMLHQKDVPTISNGISLGPTSASENPFYQYSDTSRLDQSDTINKIFQGASSSQLALNEPIESKSKSMFSGLFKPDFNIWTSGQIVLGGQVLYSPDLLASQKTKFSISGLSFGVDKALTDYLKAGVSVSFSSEETQSRDRTTKVNGNSGTGSFYASWNPLGFLFIDGILGVQTARFLNNRVDSNSGSNISGQRIGRSLFYSLSASYDNKWGRFLFAPYFRFDQMMGKLGAWSENGDPEWALSYSDLPFRSQSFTLGLRGQYDFQYDFGIISPLFRIEISRLVDGQYSQSMNYALYGSQTYFLVSTATMRSSYFANLGIKFNNISNFDSMIEFGFGGDGREFQSRGARGSLNFRF
jgi:uncharacterized protein YjdB